MPSAFAKGVILNIKERVRSRIWARDGFMSSEQNETLDIFVEEFNKYLMNNGCDIKPFNE